MSLKGWWKTRAREAQLTEDDSHKWKLMTLSTDLYILSINMRKVSSGFMQTECTQACLNLNKLKHIWDSAVYIGCKWWTPAMYILKDS